MTDSFALHPHTAPPVAGPALKPTPTQDPASALGDEPEDYTIKCICGFNEDDGNTVYCEHCDTWQHTECYYIDEHGVVPTNDDLKTKEHFCADCRERPLDRDGAIARQKDRRGELDSTDRKVKKSASKSHKKRSEPPILQVRLLTVGAMARKATFTIARAAVREMPIYLRKNLKATTDSRIP